MDGNISLPHSTAERQDERAVIVDGRPYTVTVSGSGAIGVSAEWRGRYARIVTVEHRPDWTVTASLWEAGWAQMETDWQNRVTEAVIHHVRAHTKACNG